MGAVVHTFFAQGEDSVYIVLECVYFLAPDGYISLLEIHLDDDLEVVAFVDSGVCNTGFFMLSKCVFTFVRFEGRDA